MEMITEKKNNRKKSILISFFVFFRSFFIPLVLSIIIQHYLWKYLSFISFNSFFSEENFDLNEEQEINEKSWGQFKSSSGTFVENKIEESFSFKKHKEELLKVLNDNIPSENSCKEIERNLISSFVLNRYKRSKKNGSEKWRNFQKNIILHGPPGTGKSYTAELIAKQISCYYIKVSGGSFQKMYVGSGASKLQELFSLAKKIEKKSRILRVKRPVVIIIDELDGICAKKDSGLESRSSDSTLLNTFLTIVENIVKNDINILVIATVNNIESMEEASTRDERFSRVKIEYCKSHEDFEKLSTIFLSYLKENFEICFKDCNGKFESDCSLNEKIYFDGNSSEFLSTISKKLNLIKQTEQKEGEEFEGDSRFTILGLKKSFETLIFKKIEECEKITYKDNEEKENLVLNCKILEESFEISQTSVKLKSQKHPFVFLDSKS